MCDNSDPPKNNNVTNDGDILELPAFSQTIGVTQSNNLSFFFFLVLLKGLANEVLKARNMVEVLLYAHNVIIYGSSCFHVQ